MKTNEIRQSFLDFFEKKGHKIVSSSPMVVKNDPTLMFTNAGMNQFKDFFLGYNEAKDKRVANTQKCLRVSGKHNDLEEVGVDTYHHTMFEMLGNWSFGDYFKKEAIDWAWELLTDVYKLDVDRLYVTVFEGDEADGLAADQEAIDYWKKHISEDRILMADRKDNFWEMGETGPCGPCSEIHVDMRDDEERRKIDGKTLVNQDHPQVIEVWNLVFMQFNRKADQTLEKLPATHVDTGMGLERLAMVMQGKQSNYDTDVFQALIQQLEKESGLIYGKEEAVDIAMRVISDHIRAIAFSIADGQLPSNNKAGYVIRRILRRAVRYGYQVLNLKEPFLYSLTTTLAEEMGTGFPELSAQKDLIEKVIKEEEVGFYRTLETGLKLLDELMTKVKAAGEKIIDGRDVFKLSDTFGFPDDLTALIARENGLDIDLDGFNAAKDEARAIARKATSISSDDWVILREDDEEEFIGYDFTETPVQIVKHRKVEQKGKTFYQVVFNITPFYPEGGGQVGDTGWIESDTEKVVIFDTKKENNLIVHMVKDLPKQPMSDFKAVVNRNKRELTEANHTATHLLHHVLREVLGTHVEQKGSLVNEKHLRFDFSHFSKVTDEELQIIEDKVNVAIQANISLNEKRAVPMNVAEDMGAMMLFGEKYGDLVRVIQFGDSVELCGGTHVEKTGDIRIFKITSEGSVASGIRRIEAITADTAMTYFKSKLEQFEAVMDVLKRPKNPAKAVEELIEKNNALSKELEALKKDQVKQIKAELINKIEDKGGVSFLSEILELDGCAIRDLCFQLKQSQPNLFGVIGGKSEGKATLSIIISDELAKAKDWHAGNLVREAAKLIQGGGGGQPFFATAGGKNADGLPQAINKVKELTGL
ncbi:MAG: alanine--tRNA ligase [Crocinitomicaceae bacterium]